MEMCAYHHQSSNDWSFIGYFEERREEKRNNKCLNIQFWVYDEEDWNDPDEDDYGVQNLFK